MTLKENPFQTQLFTKLENLRALILDKQEFSKAQQMIQFMTTHPLFDSNYFFDFIYISIYFKLMEMTCHYKLGQLSEFVRSSHDLKNILGSLNSSLPMPDKKIYENRSSFQNPEIFQYISELTNIVSQYESSVQEMETLENNLHQLSSLDLFRFASLMANFNKEKAIKALIEICDKDPGWNNSKASKAAINLLNSIESPEERRILLHMFNSVMKKAHNVS